MNMYISLECNITVHQSDREHIEGFLYTHTSTHAHGHLLYMQSPAAQRLYEGEHKHTD